MYLKSGPISNLICHPFKLRFKTMLLLDSGNIAPNKANAMPIKAFHAYIAFANGTFTFK